MQRTVPPHRLRPNESEWSPGAVCFFDTESSWRSTAQGELHTIRLWVGWTVIRRGTDRKTGQERRSWGTTVASLADYLEGSMRGIDTLWVVAHNLAFDLSLTRLPEELARRGWQPQAQSVNPGSAWLRLSRRSKRLTFVDSFTYLPRSLQEIGRLIAYDKPPLPDNADDIESWRARCEADVEIIGRAMLQLMDWWDRECLGHWTVTGPATGWNALRHRRDTPSLHIHRDEGITALERDAIYGGRREAYTVGKLSGGRYRDWDIHAAYPTVAIMHALPREAGGQFDRLALSRYRQLRPRYGIIAKVHIARAGGHVPVRINGEVWYPEGEVVTTLASPEIDRAIQCGCGVTIGPGVIYWLSTAYAGWASWVVDAADGRLPNTPPVARLAAKHWSRAVIGKFAAHGANIECIGDAPTMDWTCQEAVDLDRHDVYLLVNLAGKQYAVRPDGEADNSFPAVFAWVESYVRVTLDKLIRTLPHCRILQVDTDGLLVEELADVDIATWAHRALGVDLRCKLESDEVEIIGPQHLRIGQVRRLAGVSRDAVEVSPREYEYNLWPGIPWQLSSGPSEGYLRPHVRVALKGPYVHRWVLADGSTEPVRTVVRDGRTHILPWSPSSPRGSYVPLATSQHPYLQALLEGRQPPTPETATGYRPATLAPLLRQGEPVPLGAVVTQLGIWEEPRRAGGA